MVRPLLLLALVLGIALPASASAVEPRIVGGTTGPIGALPYQAALMEAGVSGAAAQFCGGSVLDASRIATAAHCVVDELRDRALLPAEIEVLTGTASLSRGGTRSRVARVSFHPGYDDETEANDVAVLSLTTPLDLVSGVTRALPLVPENGGPTSGDLLVSGWGCTRQRTGDGGDCGEQTGELRAVTVPFVPDGPCGAAYSGFAAPLMLCAGAEGLDSCQGDSGGPAVVRPVPEDPATSRLAGIVSFGQGCGAPGFPGVYAEVGAPALHAFLSSTTLPAAPRPQALGQARVTGTPEVGQTVTCVPGPWIDPATAFTFAFRRSGTSVQLSSAKPDPTYRIPPSEAGRRIVCDVRGTNGGGYGTDTSPPLAIAGTVEPAPPTTAPTTSDDGSVTAPPEEPAAPPAPEVPGLPALVARDVTGPALTLGSSLRARARDDGRVRFSLAPAKERLLAIARLRTTARFAGATLFLGSARVIAEPGERPSLRLRLGRTARATLRRRGRLQVRVALEAYDALGNRSTRSARLLLLAPRRP